jgi:ribosomal protein S21
MAGSQSDSLERKIKRLRRDYQRNVQPALRRHTYYLSKSERRRIKHQKAIKRMQRRERQYQPSL